jgi:hypothetical protein
MTLSTFWRMAALALALATVLSSSVRARETSAEAGPVKVTVKYTGPGTVDGTHRLWVWLFETPDIGPGAIPIAELSLEKNGGTATFDSVAATQVWIAVAYDVGGNFAGNAPPPSGSPIAIHGAAAGKPTPVSPGAKAVVTIAFNDAQKMQ